MISSARKKKSLRLRPSLLNEPPPGLFPSSDELLRLLVVVAVAASVAVSCHFLSTFRHRAERPFCDSGDEAHDHCEPCPDLAECIGGKWECLLGYKKKGSRCVEDGQVNKNIETLSELIVDYTCGGYAQFLCYQSGLIWFPLSNILKMLDNQHLELLKGMENEKWNLLILKAVKAAEKSLEIRITDHGTKEVKCPASLAEPYKPLFCRVRQWSQENILLLAPISILISVSVLLLSRLRRRRYISSRAHQLYEQVCETLRESSLNTTDEIYGGEKWVGLSWLRDHLLLPWERKDSTIWKKVEELILEDSRIDQYPRMIKGEQKVVLEWQVEGYLRSERMMTKKTASLTRVSKERDIQDTVLQKKQASGSALSASQKNILITD